MTLLLVSGDPPKMPLNRFLIIHICILARKISFCNSLHTMPSLFKFMNNKVVPNSIFGGTVKFTPIAELNDPAELNPTLNEEAVKASLRRLRKTGHSKRDLLELRRQSAMFQILAPEHQAVRVPATQKEADTLIRLPFYDWTVELERRLMSAAKTIASNVGVFCLSKRFDSLPMWAHYASNATGFVIEYADLNCSFKGDETGVLRQLREVVYESEITGVTFEPNSYESLFFSKYSDWSYERESRVILPLSDCRVTPLKTGNLYLFDLPPTCVRCVILGWNMPQATADAIRAAVSATNSRVSVVRALFCRGKVTFISDGGSDQSFR